MQRYIDPTAAAYGLFQLVFASLDTRLTRSLVDLCRCQAPELAFMLIKELPFGKRLQLFEAALKQLACNLSVPGEPPPEAVEHLKTACANARRIATWRNARIHAEYRLEGGFNAFYNRHGERLVFHKDECESMRDDAAMARDMFTEHVSSLMEDITLDRKISEALADMPDPEVQE